MEGHRLIDLVVGVSEWDDDDTTIYAVEPWSCDTPAILVSPAPDTIAPIERAGTNYAYFLETFVAREVLEDFAASLGGAAATDAARCERLIRYARDDA